MLQSATQVPVTLKDEKKEEKPKEVQTPEAGQENECVDDNQLNPEKCETEKLKEQDGSNEKGRDSAKTEEVEGDEPQSKAQSLQVQPQSKEDAMYELKTDQKHNKPEASAPKQEE